MTATQLKKYIADGGLDSAFAPLYASVFDARLRYIKALDGYLNTFGEDSEVFLFSAPGRTEVGGNHTDHQHGCVLAGSVDLDVIAVASKTDGNIIRVKSEGYDMDTVKLDVLKPRQSEYAHSASLIRGMCAMFTGAGLNIGGFNAYTTSNVLKGSGLSSSAAFEVLLGVILNHMYNGGEIDAVSIAKFAQGAERDFFGKPCGLMDQTASSVGGFTAIDFKDPTQPVIEKIGFDFSSSGHALCIVNTGGNHADLTHDYADITVECGAVACELGCEYLRDADEAKFESSILRLRDKTGDRAVLRAMHFFAENKRAVKEKAALSEGDFSEFLRLIGESGNSSYKYMQNVYSTSALNEQGLSLALAITEKYLNGKGACRVHGGGFAGTIQAFVPLEMLSGYKKTIESVFGEDSCFVLNIRPIGGTRIF